MDARLGSRALFPTLTTSVYANHAGMSPASLPVATAIHGAVDAIARLGATAGWDLLGAREALRPRIAALVGAQAHEIGFVPNTTTGLRAAAFGLPWRAGDRVVCFAGEFPANVTPWQRAALVHGGEVVMLDVDDYATHEARALDRLEHTLVAGRVRAVAVSAVQFQTGLRMPLAAMAERCHAHGAWLVVDAIQACGVVPIDVAGDGIDVLACGGHKWLGGSMGLGFVVVREHVELVPALAGWTSHVDAADFLLRGPGHLRYDRAIRARADHLEDGAFALALLPGLAAAIEILHALGVPAIFDHVQTWIDALEPALQGLGFASLRSQRASARSGILALRPPDDVDVIGLHVALEQQGIACATPDGMLRFAPHWANHCAEIPQVVDAVDRHLHRSR
jgi:cysteine desulfurase/selenocysteine lyase